MISFDEIKVVGRAYRDIGEHERAYLVWRAIDRGQLPRGRPGRRGPAAARQDPRRHRLPARPLARVIPRRRRSRATSSASPRSSPASPGGPSTDPAIRAELAAAGVTRSDLLLQAIRLDQAFLAQSPKNPLADEASLALVGAFLDLEDFASVVRLSRRFAKLYPKSTFLDSFQYSRGARPVPPRRIRPGDRGGREDRGGDVQGPERRRPAEPEQVAGPLHPRPDPRRPPRAGPGAGLLPPRRRPVLRRRRRGQVAHPQGAEAPRGLRDPPGRAAVAAAGVGLRASRCRARGRERPETSRPPRSSITATSRRPT